MTARQIVIYLALACICVSQVPIIQSSMSITINSPPVAALPVISIANNINPGHIFGAGIDWIQSTVPGVGSITYQSNFYASCTGPTTLLIAVADPSSVYTVYLDGVVIGSGSNADPRKFPVKLECGSHSLTITISSKISKLVNPGLIFVLNQDQSSCFNCQATGYWNEASCSCSCINTLNGCPCRKPKVWKEYPICGCGCAKFPYPTLGTPTPTVGEGFAPICLPPKYYNEGTCSCQCHYTFCLPKYYFNVNECICKKL